VTMLRKGQYWWVSIDNDPPEIARCHIDPQGKVTWTICGNEYDWPNDRVATIRRIRELRKPK
jgi:hypothetical protein